MDWSTLLSTVLGGVLVVGGGFAAQVRSERHALGREDRDRRAAIERDERQREQERDVWARSARYEAHVQFLKAHDKLFNVAASAYDARRNGSSIPVGEPPDDFMVPLWDRFTLVRLVSERTTANKARKSVVDLADFVFLKGTPQQVEFSLDEYIGAIREEFRLGPIELMGD